MVEIFINNWIIIALIIAAITSFNAPPEEDFQRSSGHYIAWMFLPIILPIVSLISLLKWNFKLLKCYYLYLFKIDEK